MNAAPNDRSVQAAEYQVTLDVDVAQDLTPDDLIELADALRPNGGAVSGRGLDFGATLSVDADSHSAAILTATMVVRAALRRIGNDVRRWRSYEAERSES